LRTGVSEVSANALARSASIGILIRTGARCRDARAESASAQRCTGNAFSGMRK
jgi:hypothetical protein